MAVNPRPERPWAVGVMRRLDLLRSVVGGYWLRRVFRRVTGRADWPVVAGAYAIGDPAAPVAVCTLTSNELIGPAARLPGVAIAGRVYTANLGIEKIVENVIANPGIRFLLLCGRDSPLFHPGETLRALGANGVSADHRVIGASGYLPVLGNVSLAQIERFRQQIEIVDCTGEVDLTKLASQTRALLARAPRPMLGDRPEAVSAEPERFQLIRPGASGSRWRTIPRDSW